MSERRKKARGSVNLGLPPLTPEAAATLEAQVARVAAALDSSQDLENIKALVTPKEGDPAWDLDLMASLGALPHPAIPSLLAACFGTAADKVRRKALKRTLHLLKTRGVAVPPELFPRPEAPPLKPGAPATLAYVSPIFGHGERYVILEGPKELLGGNLLVALLSESQGFRECHLLNTNRRQRQEFWEHFRSQGLGDLPAVPPAYAVSQLEEAFAQAPQTEAGAGRYGALRAKIQAHWGRPAEAPDLEAGLTDLAPGEQSRFLDQSRLLVLDPLFLSWLPDAQEVAPWLDKIREVQDSPLVLSEQQQQGRFEAVVEEAAAALYPPETRKYWRRRLLHMAYFLKLKGRQEEARAAQAAAADLKVAPPGPLSRENPFLKALVQQALRLAWEFQQRGAKKSPGSGLVLPPTEPLILKR